MSDDTRTALDEAMAAHFADENDGAMLTGYVVKATGQSIEGMEGNFHLSMWDCPEGQSAILTLGLASALAADTHAWYAQAREVDDD